MLTVSRADAAELSGISIAQLDYMVNLGVVFADIGNQRKRFSLQEVRMVVTAGRR